LIDFFAMGGYGAYVWSAFGFAAVVLIGLLMQSWRAFRQREVELEQLRQVVRPTKAGGARMVPRRATDAAAAGGDE
jgi:heme exporter protein D